MNYQTIPLPDGSIEQGLFPTIDWFNNINKHVSFYDKTVLDLGCCQSSYGIQALQKGARFIIGIDNDINRINESQKYIQLHNLDNQFLLLHKDIESFLPGDRVDITIFSMIIHWLNNSKDCIKQYMNHCNTAIFIYRLPELNVTGFHPTLDELSELVNKPLIHNSVIMDTNIQHIGLAIYGKSV